MLGANADTTKVGAKTTLYYLPSFVSILAWKLYEDYEIWYLCLLNTLWSINIKQSSYKISISGLNDVFIVKMLISIKNKLIKINLKKWEGEVREKFRAQQKVNKPLWPILNYFAQKCDKYYQNNA